MNETDSHYNPNEETKKKFIIPTIIIILVIIGVLYSGLLLIVDDIDEPTSITYDEIIKITKSNKGSYTDAKWEAQFDPYIGKKVSWSGWVYEVTSKGSYYEVKIDMDSPDILLSLDDVTLITTDKKAATLDIDQFISFEGFIKEIKGNLTKYMIKLKNGSITKI